MSHRRVGAPQSPSPEHDVAAWHWPSPATTPTQVWPDGHPFRPGPQPATQKPFGPLQTRPESAAPHAASPAAPSQPHRPVAGRHWGRAPAQRAALVVVHSVQAPASGPVFWQAGCAGSGQLGAPSATQPTQVFVVAEQTGVVPPQSAFARQPTQTPPPPLVSHRGVAAPQRLVSAGVQAAHAPVLRHTGNFGSQSALDAQARHVCAPVSQTGRVPRQSAFATHSTQVLVVASQTLAAAAQAPGLPAAHAWQAPVAPHTGVAPPHSPSAAQARHVCVAPLHTGVAPLQSAFATHATQAPAAVSQRGAAPPHVVAFVAEHAPHAPDGWHAGVDPPHSPSPTQPRQTCVTPSQTGLPA
jgi:hypothetical protein